MDLGTNIMGLCGKYDVFENEVVTYRVMIGLQKSYLSVLRW